MRGESLLSSAEESHLCGRKYAMSNLTPIPLAVDTSYQQRRLVKFPNNLSGCRSESISVACMPFGSCVHLSRGWLHYLATVKDHNRAIRE